jgi:hypothetical protein
MQRSQLARGLRQHEWFRDVPSQVAASWSYWSSRENCSRIKAEGIMRVDGTVHPAVEAFRKYTGTRLSDRDRGEARAPDRARGAARLGRGNGAVLEAEPEQKAASQNKAPSPTTKRIAETASTGQPS